jgi:hypothetical protein
MGAILYSWPLRVEPTYRPYLSLQSDHPLSALYHSRNMLKKLSKDHVPSDGLDIVDNFRTVIIGDSTIPLSSIGVIFHKLHNEIREGWKKLLMGFDLETVIEVPDTLYDQPDNLTPGFYFGDVPRNNLKRYERTLTELIFRDSRFQGKYGAVTSKGVLELNQSMCHKFLEEVVSIRSMLGTLLHISTPGPYRGTEYAATCVRNVAGGNCRNVKAIAGKLCLVSNYNKTSSVVSILQHLFVITVTNEY